MGMQRQRKRLNGGGGGDNDKSGFNNHRGSFDANQNEEKMPKKHEDGEERNFFVREPKKTKTQKFFRKRRWKR